MYIEARRHALYLDLLEAVAAKPGAVEALRRVLEDRAEPLRDGEPPGTSSVGKANPAVRDKVAALLDAAIADMDLVQACKAARWALDHRLSDLGAQA